MFGRLGWAEILIIVVLVLILFGHNKIPTMMKNVADGLKTFKREMKSDKKGSTDVALDESAKKVKSARPQKAAQKSVKTAKPAKSASVVGAYVEFGAYASAAAAQNMQRKLIANDGDLFEDVEFVILNDAAAGGNRAFKLRAPFATATAAKKFQAAAASAGVKCKVI